MNKEQAWQQLADHARVIKPLHLRELLADPDRFQQLSLSQGPLLLDLSKQRITPDTLPLLQQLAESCDLQGRIEALFKGEPVNTSEQRPALHTALRAPATEQLLVEGEDVIPSIQQTLIKMEHLVRQIHSGQWRGFSGEPIDTIVNVGVGGSDLGPMMACKALDEYQPTTAQRLNFFFVSSMDGSQLNEVLTQCNPATTLFILASKSFTTIDTLANAITARQWLQEASQITAKEFMRLHFIAVTACAGKALEWGIPQENQLHFAEWVGGRYSLWSAIGLPVALKIGMQGFQRMLSGAHEMDLHFRHAPFMSNLPALLGLVEVWNINLLGIHAHAILPYDGRLSHLPSYLEQLEMESNGKSVTQAGDPVQHRTCPILWGEVGPNAQHAFYQLLHQGTEAVMCDFIAPARRYDDQRSTLKQQHRLSLANCLAQSRTLALGDAVLPQPADEAHRRYKGNQPSSTLLLDELTPESFGALIALYEHKVYCQAVIWNINPFDQWGVELGKVMATELLDALEQHNTEQFDVATEGLLDAIRQLNREGDL